MTLQDFLSRLDNVKPKSGYYMARCPAHDDKENSLSLRVGEDERILLKCHRGCTVPQIVAAMGLSEKDLFPEPAEKRSSRQSKSIVATYKYISPEGVAYEKIRYSDKSFIWRQPDGKGGYAFNRKGITPTLYKRVDILPDTVYFVEGEKDVDSLYNHSAAAVSPPDGAKSKWQPQYTEALTGKNVVILPDNDKPGQALAQTAAAELNGKASSVKVLDLTRVWPQLPEKGDISDIFAVMPSEDVFMKLEELEANTPEWATEDLEKSLKLIRASDVPYEPPKFLIPPYFQIGKGTLIQADPGTGKTAFMCAIAAHITTGKPIFDIPVKEPGNVLMISVEDDLPILRGRIEASGGDLTHVSFMEEPAGLTFNSPEIEKAIKAINAKMVVFDPLQAFIGAKVDMHRSNETRPELAKLFEMAGRNNCSITIVGHNAKGSKERSAITQGLGSVDIPAAMRSVMSIIRNPEDESECIVIHVKCSNAPKGRSIKYRIGDRGGVTWTGFSDMTVDDLNIVVKRKEKGIPYENEPLVQVFNQLIADKPAGGFWSYSDFKAEGSKILGVPPYGDLNELRSKLDNGLDKELLQRSGLVVTHGARGSHNRHGIRIERYIQPKGFQLKIES